MKSTKSLTNHHPFSQADANNLIKVLIDPKVENHDKVELLQTFTERELQQKELTHLVRSLIQTMYPVQPSYPGAMCVCGTGGDKSNSFNISTTVAFIVAAAGVPIIKHGNKSITSHSGSTDLLQQLNIQTTKVEDVSQRLDNKGLAFVSAPEAYPVMKYIQPVRKMIGKPTFFNLIGPIINPFALTYQVMGVFDPNQLDSIIHTLKDLGRRRAIVLHGAHGMDEATLSGNNLIYELDENGNVNHYTLNAQDLGFSYAPDSELKGGSPEENRRITLDILNGKDRSSKRDVVVLNAAIALYVAEKVHSIQAGISIAEYLIDNGLAMKQCLIVEGNA
ncbi:MULTISPECIES: anthranilate phosphoribosyltransferase [Staphylococcus]|jgi:anthranilate phosphoribosyltransferase|uniref:Anthranilate phosphoribosyltransferase n=1 Tax=Staphylococcus lugdunensis TaxID=28035 RepID=A0ABD4EE89_STALU|nr:MULTISPECIES: anthranilate phosphoribosyltransferase [Staphylococcus]ARJ14020.1 anthranilate phosphoribosyltransferase [Staphylococcus lugdunensis]EFU84928.1 anthranilate phosphoribosyltransferase [Staphylococcus lugdunensis M23590]KAK57327.1 anthranilate phosphoribosyltransferase [Staphylococcus lugdunensis VCU150]KXA37325.1 anthranilate phosphoribosyltransferase [Staphylococcus lugdunensis]MCH8666446.1 anthranilate phosphoribosyltransferase [Staphylococcus lugdunensis]